VEKKSSKTVAQMNIQELENYCKEKDYHMGWIVHQLLSRGRTALEEYAKLKNYSQAWVNKQLSAGEEKRIENKRVVFEFMRANQHVTVDFLKDYASKQLKKTHSQEEIEILIPKIIVAFNELKLGILK
jgi:hypothetical protein